MARSIHRPATTIIELIVVIGMIMLMIGLLIPAVSGARRVANRLKDANTLKNLGIALQSYAATYQGNLPGSHVQAIFTVEFGNTSPLINILPFLDCGVSPPYESRQGPGTFYSHIPMLVSPSDPSNIVVQQHLQYWENEIDKCHTSYSMNYQVFEGKPHLTRTITDGASNTISFGQHYYRTLNRTNVSFYILLNSPRQNGYRSGTFADANYADNRPLTEGDPPISRGSLPGTFQHMPNQMKFESDGRYLQSMHPAGLLVGMLDGAVRTVAPNINETAFWALVTPRGNEVHAE
jgi:type II secretory pathway pseudopilin PulG